MIFLLNFTIFYKNIFFIDIYLIIKKKKWIPFFVFKINVPEWTNCRYGTGHVDDILCRKMKIIK